MDDISTIAVLISCVLGAAGYLFGAWNNPFWKCKQLRGLLKKNYVIISLLDKDRKSMIMSVVNAVKGKITYKDFAWYVTDGSIWRATEIKASDEQPEQIDSMGLKKGASRFNSGQPKKRNFMDSLMHEEGVPIVFLDMDSLTPVQFEKAISKVKANEISSFLSADWLNEYAKMQAQTKQLSIYMLVTIVLVLANLVVSYTLISGVGEKMTAIEGQVSRIPVIENSLNLILAKEGIVGGNGTATAGGTIVYNVK